MPSYQVEVDWGGNNQFRNSQALITGYVRAGRELRFVRGKQSTFALSPPVAGSFNAVLDNESRVFSPRNNALSNPLNGLVLPGRRVRVTGCPGAQTVASAIKRNKPLAYWRLDDGPNIILTDYTGNPGVSGNVLGTLTFQRPPVPAWDGVGFALGFPGTDNSLFYAFGDADVWETITTEVTLVCFVKKAAVTQDTGAGLITRGYGGGQEIWSLDCSETVWRFFFWENGNLRSVDTTFGAGDTNWHMVAGVLRGGQRLEIWVDGVERNTNVLGAPITLTASNIRDVYVGARPSGVPLPIDLAFNGDLDEVAIYNRALPADQLEAIWESSLSPSSKHRRLWLGLIDDYPQHPAFGERTVDIPSLGLLSRLVGKPISTALFQNITTDQAIAEILTAVGVTTAERVLNTGSTTLLWWWADDKDAFQAAVEVLNTEGPGASLYEDRQGRVVFEGRQYRLNEARCVTTQAVFADMGEPPYRLEIDYNPGIKNVVNRVEATANLRAVQALGVVWQLGQNVTLSANEVKTFIARSANPFTAAVTPVNATDYTVTSGSLASVTLDRTSGASVTITLTAGAAGATVTGLQLRAQPVTVTNSVKIRESSALENNTSISRYGLRPYTLPIWPEVNPEVARDFCNTVVQRYRVPVPIVTVPVLAIVDDGSTVTYDAAIDREISDRIGVVDFQTGLTIGVHVDRIEYSHTMDLPTVRLVGEEAREDTANFARWGTAQWGVHRWGF